LKNAPLMMNTAAVIVAGGQGLRFGASVPKQFLPLAGEPLLIHTLKVFEKSSRIQAIYLVLPAEWIPYFQTEILPRFSISKLKKIVAGGKSRQDSTRQGFNSLDSTVELVAVHDAARPLVSVQTIDRCVQEASRWGAALAATPSQDTVKELGKESFVGRTLDRKTIYLAQTPQIFHYALLKEALEKADAEGVQGTDEASLVERLGKPVKIVETEPSNLKVTTSADFSLAEILIGGGRGRGKDKMRIGIGYDVHPLVAGRKLILGGVEIPFEKGLKGHSDADALLHAIADALLGALSLGDLGKHFPDTDPRYQGISSLKLLKEVYQKVLKEDFCLANLDSILIAEKPKLSPYLEQMVQNIAECLNLKTNQVSVKATREEGLGFTGRGEGIAAKAVVLLKGKGSV